MSSATVPKDRVKLVAIATGIVIAIYAVPYCLKPVYMRLFLTNPQIYRSLIWYFALFALCSAFLIFVSKPDKRLSPITIGLYMICLVLPNLLVVLFGPAWMLLHSCRGFIFFPFPYYPE